jgi:hypothetical protein
MGSKSDKAADRASISHDLLAIRPPARLPDGRANPDYQKWYRKTAKGKEVVANYNKSKACKVAWGKYWASPKAKETRKKYLARPEVNAAIAKRRGKHRKLETPDDYANRIISEVGDDSLG